MTRIERLAAGLEEPLLVTSLVNVRYLTGFVSSNAAVLVDPAGEGTLYTDFRYAEAASDVDGVTFEEMPRALLAALAERLAGRRIGVEAPHLSLANADVLRNGGVEVVATAGAVEALRAVKDDGELELMRRAAAISDRVFEELAREPFVGRTETELAWWIEQAWHEAGADGASFSAVVAAGENGARPHAKPRDVPIPEGTLVVVDAGCSVDGYASDCTRTFFTGEPAGRAREVYDLCLTAQLDGLAAVAPGADGRVHLADRDWRSRPGRAVRARARPRRRARGARAAHPATRVGLGAGGGEHRHRRARSLPARGARRADRGPGPRDRRRLRAADDRHEGAGPGRLGL